MRTAYGQNICDTCDCITLILEVIEKTIICFSIPDYSKVSSGAKTKGEYMNHTAKEHCKTNKKIVNNVHVDTTC